MKHPFCSQEHCMFYGRDNLGIGYCQFYQYLGGADAPEALDCMDGCPAMPDTHVAKDPWYKIGGSK